jgi:hypothetical protein
MFAMIEGVPTRNLLKNMDGMHGLEKSVVPNYFIKSASEPLI